jgi:predicted dehydrogenase/nucleoside-diphosphate-sugar epimerase
MSAASAPDNGHKPVPSVEIATRMRPATRVGLLGAGYIAQAHAKAILALPQLELHAICDRVDVRARALADEFGVPHVYDSIDTLAASDCDAVHVLLPPAFHLDAARTLIAAGKAVLLEKPMGPDAAACHALDAFARERGVRLGVSHNFLFLGAYEAVRDAVHAQRYGGVDQLTLNWLYELPQLHFGPFDGWMFDAPRNLVLELGSHLAAFALDLVGPVDIVASHSDDGVVLPGGKLVMRKWHAIGRAGRTNLVFNLATTPGRADRSFSLRSLGALVHFDFDKAVGWVDAQASDNPVIDNLINSRRAVQQIGGRAAANFGRYFGRALRKRAGANPFLDGIARSVATFYRDGPVDPRHSAEFGARVIELCSAIAAQGLRQAAISQVPAQAASGPVQAGPVQAGPAQTGWPAPADTLVIGGTGFIGKPLVRRLCEDGRRVRVLTRNRSAARLELAGLDVDIVQGWHGNADDLKGALAGIRIVYHLAKAEGKRWDDYVRQDIEPTRLLALACIEAGAERLIYTGTIDSFDSARPNTVIATNSPTDRAIGIRNLYARSKAACEVLLTDLAKTRGLPLVIARPGIVIGAGSPPTHLGVAQFLSPTHVRYFGNGENKLPFILVDDVAEALARAATAPGIEGQQLLLSDVPLLSARDYVAAMGEAAGVVITAEPRPIWRYWAPDWAKELLKAAIRHPNRRKSALHDWACKAHLARYDATATYTLLDWQPAGTRDALVARAIKPSVDRFLK